jgi:hypothetical protein
MQITLLTFELCKFEDITKSDENICLNFVLLIPENTPANSLKILSLAYFHINVIEEKT